MSIPIRIGAVVLTYNSTADLPVCLDGLLAQENIELYLIVVDNASIPEARLQMEADFLTRTNGVILDVTEATPTKIGTNHAIFIRNNRNSGYSAGNNIGARFAVALGCEAVLIINPDVRVSDCNYLFQLTEKLLAKPDAAVAASSIFNLAGANENPMWEPEFHEEIMWPIGMIALSLGLKKNIIQQPIKNRSVVNKVSGCCFLIKKDFLKEINYFDENVFLYCEEAILAIQIQTKNRSVIFDESLKVTHAHVQNMKGDPVHRYKTWSRSRGYYHRAYSDYGLLRRGALCISRWITLGLVFTKKIASKCK